MLCVTHFFLSSLGLPASRCDGDACGGWTSTQSTLQKLKECRAMNVEPKQAVSTVSKEKGRIVETKAVGDIPDIMDRLSHQEPES